MLFCWKTVGVQCSKNWLKFKEEAECPEPAPRIASSVLWVSLSTSQQLRAFASLEAARSCVPESHGAGAEVLSEVFLPTDSAAPSHAERSLWMLTFCCSLFGDEVFKGAKSAPVHVLSIKTSRGSRAQQGHGWDPVNANDLQRSWFKHFNYPCQHPIASIYGYELKCIVYKKEVA